MFIFNISCSFIGINLKKDCSFQLVVSNDYVYYFQLTVFIGIKIFVYVYCLFGFTPLLMNDKKGEKNSGLYMYVSLCVMHICCFIGILSLIACPYMFI